MVFELSVLSIRPLSFLILFGFCASPPRTLCAKANATLPDDPSYVTYLEELFGRKMDDVRILTPFICDFGNRVKLGYYLFRSLVLWYRGL